MDDPQLQKLRPSKQKLVLQQSRLILLFLGLIASMPLAINNVFPIVWDPYLTAEIIESNDNNFPTKNINSISTTQRLDETTDLQEEARDRQEERAFRPDETLQKKTNPPTLRPSIINNKKRRELKRKEDAEWTRPPTVAPNGFLWHRLASHGFGNDMRQMAGKLIDASAAGRELRIMWAGKGFLYARDKACAKADTLCFFRPVNVTQALENPPKTIGEAFKLLMVPNDKTERELDRLGRSKSPVPCGVIHVRHGDVILNRSWGNKSTVPLYRYRDLGDYVEVFQQQAKDIKNVVLLTDDQNVIDDVPRYEGKDGLKFHYIKRKRFRGAEVCLIAWLMHFRGMGKPLS